MATVPQYIASTQYGDSGKHLGSASVYVSATDAKAYVAAADDSARAATKVGLLLTSVSNMTDAAGGVQIKHDEVATIMINGTFAYQDKDDKIYNSNRWRVTGLTTNNGIPVQDSFTIPQRAAGLVMESNGVNVDLGGTEALDLIAQVLDTALSRYGTAFTSVIEIVANDS